MGFLKDLLLGKKQYLLTEKEKKKLKTKERKAYLKSLTKARIVRAKELGRQKGTQKPMSPLGTVRSVIGGGVEGAKSYMDMFDLGLGPDLGYGTPTKRKKTKRKKKKR